MIVNLSPACHRWLQARRTALLPSPASEKWRRKEPQTGQNAGVGFAPFSTPAKGAGIFDATNGAENAWCFFCMHWPVIHFRAAQASRFGRSKSSCRQRREGPPDMIARLLIEKMGAALGQR
jgi:hypothetical protein